MSTDFGLMQGKLDPQNVEVNRHEYPIQHAVCAEEIEDIRSWLLKVFEQAL
jgi:predicted esterase